MSRPMIATGSTDRPTEKGGGGGGEIEAWKLTSVNPIRYKHSLAMVPCCDTHHLKGKNQHTCRSHNPPGTQRRRNERDRLCPTALIVLDTLAPGRCR